MASTVTPNLSAMPPRVSPRRTVYTTGVRVGVAVLEGVGVSADVSVGLGMSTTVAVSVGSGARVSMVPKVAVTTMTSGDPQVHCCSRFGVLVGVRVTVAVCEGVEVMLGVNVGVLVFKSIKIGNFGPPVIAI